MYTYSLSKIGSLWFLIDRQSGLISTAKTCNLGCMLMQRLHSNISLGKKRKFLDGIFPSRSLQIGDNIPPGYDSEGNIDLSYSRLNN